jgi:hypothetical protein
MALNNMKKMNFLIVAESSFDDGLAFICGLKNEHQRNYREVFFNMANMADNLPLAQLAYSSFTFLLNYPYVIMESEIAG